jgi:cytochrome P450
VDIKTMPALSGAKPIMGHNAALRTDRWGFIERIVRDDHPICQLVNPFVPGCIVSSPEIMQELLVDNAKHVEKADMTRFTLYPLAGEGLFTSRTALWRKQRKLMAPLFHPSQMPGYAEAMVDCAERDVALWSDDSVIEIAKETTRITMSIAGRTLFDADTFGEADAIGEALTVALEWPGKHAGSALSIAHILGRRFLLEGADRIGGRVADTLRRVADKLEGPVFIPGADGRELRAAVDVLDRHVQRMIDQRRASGLDRADLLTKLLVARDEDDGSRMTDKQVRDEVLTLFVAGHETTANGLAWALQLAATHPEWYARMEAEVDALGHRPTFADLPRLDVCLRVFKEALRLYPPVYGFARQVIEPTRAGGYDLPARTIIFLCPYAMHHRAAVWPDPERFDPDRFLPENEAKRHKLAWMPFGAGPRVCIGSQFALIEAQLILATLLAHARFESLGPVAPDPHATLRPASGMPMRVRLRRNVEPRAA